MEIQCLGLDWIWSIKDKEHTPFKTKDSIEIEIKDKNKETQVSN